jgi:hypothetical protein
VQILEQSYRKGVARKPDGERQPGLEAVRKSMCQNSRCDRRNEGNPDRSPPPNACSRKAQSFRQRWLYVRGAVTQLRASHAIL